MARIEAKEQERSQALDAVDAVPVAYNRLAAAAHALGQAWKAMQDAETDANNRVRKLVPTLNGHMLGNAPSFHTKPLLEGLLWLQLGDGWEIDRNELFMDNAGRLTPDVAGRIVITAKERARAEVIRGADKAIQKDREAAEKLAATAGQEV